MTKPEGLGAPCRRRHDYGVGWFRLYPILSIAVCEAPYLAAAVVVVNIGKRCDLMSKAKEGKEGSSTNTFGHDVERAESYVT